MLSVLAAVALLLPAPTHASFPIGAYMIPVNDFPQGLHAGDCNDDGIPDIIVADQGSNDLTILRNFDSGHFAFFTSINGTNSPRGALCADFNEDGGADVAAIDRDNGKLNIYLQKAGGGYQKAYTYDVGKQPNSIAVGDLDNDHHLDLVVISTSSGIMAIRYGDGTGAFPRSTSTALPMKTPLYATLADFDLDNNLDIAVAGGGIGTRSIVFYMGDGHGLFTPSPTTLSGLPIPRSISGADVDQDGLPDLTILSKDGTVTIYLGTPAGTFTLAKTFILPVSAQSIDIQDFDGDKKMDIAVGCAQINSVLIMRGLGGLNFTPLAPFDSALDTVIQPPGSGIPRIGTFDDVLPSTDLLSVNGATKSLDAIDITDGSTFATAQLAQVPDPPTTALLADMNNDGIPDAVVTTRTHKGVGVQVLFGDASGGYTLPPPGLGTCGNGILEPGEFCDNGGQPGCKNCVPQIGSTLGFATAADVDGDGNQDLVMVGSPGRLQLLLGNGKGQFSLVRTLAKVTPKIPVAVGDFDGDGAVDIVAMLHQTDARGLTLMHNDGTGNFTNTALVPGLTTKGPLLAADFDRDGALDVAIGTSTHGKNAITVLLNDGSGAMTPATTISVPRGLKTIAAADFNEDGWLDLIGSFGAGTHSTMTLYAGEPGGKFGAGQTALDSSSMGVKGAATTILDVNDDSHADVVLCRSGQQTTCNANFGTGLGTFSNVPPVNGNFIGRQLKNVAVEDLDGDGALDFIGVSRLDNRVVVLFRDAAQAVTQRLVLVTGGIKPFALAIGDVDGDTRPDLVVAHESSDDVTIFLNKGNRVFQTLGPVSLKPVGRVPSGVGLVDLDGDDKLDLVVSFQETSNVGFFLLKDLAHLTTGGLVNIGSIATGTLPVEMILADLNGDLIPDIVTVNNRGVPPASTVTPTPIATPTATDPASTASAAGTPGPTQSPGPTAPTATSTPGPSGSLTLLLSSGVGQYTRTDMSTGGIDPWAVAAADVNHDTFLDLLVVNSQDTTQAGTVVTFLNDGSANFTKASTHRRGRKRPRDLCTGDFNGDGDTDVAVASTATADILLLFGNGDGTWKRGERVYSVGKFPRSVACRDVDGDTLTDVVFGRLNRGDIDVIQTKK